MICRWCSRTCPSRSCLKRPSALWAVQVQVWVTRSVPWPAAVQLVFRSTACTHLSTQCASICVCRKVFPRCSSVQTRGVDRRLRYNWRDQYCADWLGRPAEKTCHHSSRACALHRHCQVIRMVTNALLCVKRQNMTFTVTCFITQDQSVSVILNSPVFRFPETASLSVWRICCDLGCVC